MIYIYVIFGICVLMLGIILIVETIGNKVKYKKKKDIKIKDDIRLTVDSEPLDENGDTNITLNQSDMLFKKDEIYVVGKERGILPGKYTVLNSIQDDKKTEVVIRINNVISHIKHGGSIVLAEDDEFTVLNQNIIFR